MPGGEVGLQQAVDDIRRGAVSSLIVADASIVANVIGDDSIGGGRARHELRNAGEFATPNLVDVETVAILRNAMA